MPKSPTLKKVLLIGSGPIKIGQAAEFDYAGSQACKAVREEGIEVVLVNSNPATIQTDPDTADKVYVEPLNAEIIAEIIKKEKPDGILSGMGGQTALNLTAELYEMGVLEGIQILGTPLDAIYHGEDRKLFKKLMQDIGEPVPRSFILTDMSQLEDAIQEVGFPAIIRSAYTLGGLGGGIANTKEDLIRIVGHGLAKSRIHQVLIEESLKGWNEIEFEVMRDASDTCIIICGMENVDPMGIHTGDSVVVAPILSLTSEESGIMRRTAIKIIRSLNIQGGCNIQFAFKNGDYRVIEVNPRVSRSSALASKATGYPIARVAAKVAIGFRLDEIDNAISGCTPACFEPAVDYVVVKVARWPFDKFKTADRTLMTAMKSTGEVMALGRTVEEGFKKALRSLDTDINRHTDINEIRTILCRPTDERFPTLFDAFRIGMSLEEIYELTQIEPFFLEKIRNIVNIETKLKHNPTATLVKFSKKFGFSNSELRELTGWDISRIERLVGLPIYKMVDTYAAEFPTKTPYYYSTWGTQCELPPATKKKKILILGSGAIRIGQGIEFDYCTVHAVKSIREEGIEVHIINNTPETVSTDFDISDRLYFEPMQLEDVVNILRKEEYDGVIVQFGGQNSVNLALPLQEKIKFFGLKTKILGTTPNNMDVAEDRNRFSALLEKDSIPSPANCSARSEKEAYTIASKIGYPVLVRPSYVLGGRAMELVHNELELKSYIREAVRVSNTHPVLIDRYLDNATELDVDAVCDGKDVLIGGIMEHIEQAGVHSGDSACVIPTQTLTEDQITTVKDYTRKIALSLQVVGLINIQYAIHQGRVYVIEANPRASRTVPFVSKATGIPLAKIAAKVMLGMKLKNLGYHEKEISHVAVKEVLLPFSELPGVDPILGPEMKSTGEVIGIDYDFGRAFYKASQSADNKLPLSGNVFMSVFDDHKEALVPIARKLFELGFNLYGTAGTVKHLAKEGISLSSVRKVSEGSPNIVDMIRGSEIDLVINIPSDKEGRADHLTIIRETIDYAIPYETTIIGAEAAVQAIESIRKEKITIEPLSHYHNAS